MLLIYPFAMFLNSQFAIRHSKFAIRNALNLPLRHAFKFAIRHSKFEMLLIYSFAMFLNSKFAIRNALNLLFRHVFKFEIRNSKFGMLLIYPFAMHLNSKFALAMLTAFPLRNSPFEIRNALNLLFRHVFKFEIRNSQFEMLFLYFVRSSALNVVT